MNREASVRVPLTKQKPPGTAVGAACASQGGEVAPSGVRLLPRPQRETRGLMCLRPSSLWSRLTMIATLQTRTACWTPMANGKRAKMTWTMIRQTTSRSSWVQCCSQGWTSSPCVCLGATKGSQRSRPGSSLLECGLFTPTVTSGKWEKDLSFFCQPNSLMCIPHLTLNLCWWNKTQNYVFFLQLLRHALLITYFFRDNIQWIGCPGCSSHAQSSRDRLQSPCDP